MLREALQNEALLEDASTSLLRVVQEDEGAGDEVRPPPASALWGGMGAMETRWHEP